MAAASTSAALRGRRAKPKSAIFGVPSGASRILAGVGSRNARCRPNARHGAARPRAARARPLPRAGRGLPCSDCCSEPPSTNSNAAKCRPSDVSRPVRKAARCPDAQARDRTHLGPKPLGGGALRRVARLLFTTRQHMQHLNGRPAPQHTVRREIYRPHTTAPEPTTNDLIRAKLLRSVPAAARPSRRKQSAGFGEACSSLSGEEPMDIQLPPERHGPLREPADTLRPAAARRPPRGPRTRCRSIQRPLPRRPRAAMHSK